MKRAEVVELGAGFGSAREPVFVMEVPEVTGAGFRGVEISEGDVDADFAVAHRGGPELAGFYFNARVEGDRPFDEVAFAVGLDVGGGDHGFAVDPAGVSGESLGVAAGLAFEKATFAQATEAALGEIDHHLPGATVAFNRFVSLEGVGCVEQDFHLVAKPGEGFTRGLAVDVFVGLGVFFGKPSWGVDAVKEIVVDFEGEVEALAIVLHPTFEVEVFGVCGG